MNIEDRVDKWIARIAGVAIAISVILVISKVPLALIGVLVFGAMIDRVYEDFRTK